MAKAERRKIDSTFGSDSGRGTRSLDPNELAFNGAATQGLDVHRKEELVSKPEYQALFRDTVVPLVEDALAILVPVLEGELGPGLYPTNADMQKQIYEMVGTIYRNEGGVPDESGVRDLRDRVKRALDVNREVLRTEEEIQDSFSEEEYDSLLRARMLQEQYPAEYTDVYRKKMDTYHAAAGLFNRDKKEQIGIAPNSGRIARAIGWLLRSKEARREFDALQTVRTPIDKVGPLDEPGLGVADVATKDDLSRVATGDMEFHAAVLAPERRRLLGTFLSDAGIHARIREEIKKTMKEKVQTRSSAPVWEKKGKAAEVAAAGVEFTKKIVTGDRRLDRDARFYQRILSLTDRQVEKDVRQDFAEKLAAYEVKKGYSPAARTSDVGADRMPAGFSPEREIPKMFSALDALIVQKGRLGGRDKAAVFTMLEKLCREKAQEIQTRGVSGVPTSHVHPENARIQIDALLALAKSYKDSAEKADKANKSAAKKSKKSP